MKKKYDITKDDINNWLSNEAEEAPVELTDQSEEALIAYAKAHSLTPPSHLREKILGKMKLLKRQGKQPRRYDINNLPFLDKNSNWLEWEETVKEIEPPDDFENAHLHPLESNDKRELFIAWVKEYIEEEVHHDLLESFLLLEGTCECHITDEKGQARVVRMGQGDFITMQLGETHDIVITSKKPAKAILQWAKLAA